MEGQPRNLAGQALKGAAAVVVLQLQRRVQETVSDHNPDRSTGRIPVYTEP